MKAAKRGTMKSKIQAIKYAYIRQPCLEMLMDFNLQCRSKQFGVSLSRNVAGQYAFQNP